jgi:hypothetical protein
MKCLILISSCFDFEINGNNDALRETWLRDVAKFPGLDCRFVIGTGQGAVPMADYLLLPDVEDDYGHLTYKTRASHEWAVAEGYDFVFQCFADTYAVLDRLMDCGFESHDYHGDFRTEGNGPGTLNYASGGPGYWLSRKACEMLCGKPILGVWRDDLMPYVEDMWVGNVLGRRREELIYFDDTKRFINKGQSIWPRSNNQIISSHLSCGHPNEKYCKEMMYAAHESWLKSR